MKRAALLLIGSLALPAPAAELGRLFFTPQARAALDRQRQLNIKQAQTMEGEALSMDGIVRRGDGHSTVWINGKPHDITDPEAGVAIQLGRDASSATLRVGDEAPAGMRVGETLNRGTREKSDVLGNGEVAVRRTPAAR